MTNFLAAPLVEVLIALRRVVQSDHRDVDRLGDLDLVEQNRLHQRPVVAHHRALAGGEAATLGPAQPDADRQVAQLGRLAGRPGILGDVEARNADVTAGADDLHHVVEHLGGNLLTGLGTSAARLETDAVHRRVDLGDAEDLVDLIGHAGLDADVHRLAAEAPRLLQPFRDQVAHDHDGRAEQLAGGGAGQTHRASAGAVDGAAGTHARGIGTVKAGREDVREQREVLDLGEGLVLVAELQQVEVGVRTITYSACPPTHPPHVHIAVSGARPRRVDAEANPGLAFLAVCGSARRRC